jgi:hypothetical protein
VSGVSRSPHAFRFLGRSFLALVFSPEPPVPAWLDELDLWLRRSTGFFAEKPVVLDLSRLSLSRVEYDALIADLRSRRIRVISVEGVDASWRGPDLGPLGNGGRSNAMVDLPAADAPLPEANPVPQPEPISDPAPGEPASLLIDVPVRSGQTVFFPEGDVTVIGSVASGYDHHDHRQHHWLAGHDQFPRPVAAGFCGGIRRFRSSQFPRAVRSRHESGSGAYCFGSHPGTGNRGLVAHQWLCGQSLEQSQLRP